MKILVVASSFPSINQPWINTHIHQLLEGGATVSILSFKTETSPEENHSATNLLPHATFLTRDPREVAVNVLKGLLRSPINMFGRLLRHLRHAMTDDLSVRELAKSVTLSAYVDRALDGRKFDLVHVHFDQDVLPLLPWKRLHNVPFVTTFHGLNPKGIEPPTRSVRRVTYGGVDMVLVNTEFAKHQAVSLGCPAEKIRVLPQGLELQRFPFRPHPPPSHNQPINILSVGRLDSDKGQEYSILALRRLLNAGQHIKWTFVGSGPNRAKLERLCLRLGVTAHAQFKNGLTPEALRLEYERAHVFVLASTSNNKGFHIETQGVVLLEAQAAGCLVIATSVGGIPECIDHNKNGFLVKERSSREIARSIINLQSNRDRWPEIQTAALHNVRDRFDSNLIRKRMMALYATLLEGRNPPLK